MFNLSEILGFNSTVRVPLTCVCNILLGPLVFWPNLWVLCLFFSTFWLGTWSYCFHLQFSSIRFSLIKCSSFCVIACQSAMSGMFRNMCLLKTRLPGLLPKVVWMPVCMACVAIDSASSMKSFALVTSRGGSQCRRVCRTFPTIWCIHSQIA